jgi:hypothetical protein
MKCVSKLGWSVANRVPEGAVRRTSMMLIFCAVSSASLAAAAAAPTLDHIFPVAVRVGSAAEISAIGKFSPWPTKVWADAPGIMFRATDKVGKFIVEISPDVSIGAHLIRLYNETGASAPRFLIVTANQQATESEPNDEFAKAPVVEGLPVSINGRLNKSGDVDSYAVKLEAEQTLIASLEAFVLGSPVDAVLRLVDARGLEVALNHDDGRTLDPRLAWTAKKAGTYVVQVFGFAHPATSDVKFTGGDACVYRLHLSRGAQVKYTLPLGLQRSTVAKLRLVGWNIGGASNREVEVDGSSFPASATEAAWQAPDFENVLTLPFGDGPEYSEEDFSKGGELPQVMAAPFAVTGCIEKVGEEDQFRFQAIEGDKFLFEIRSASLGFPLDAWLGIQDTAGKELARNDDSTSTDPVLEWVAPATGTFVAVVGSVLHRGGGDYLYRMSVRRPAPGFTAVIAEPGFSIEPGKTTKIKVTARRTHGFNSKLVVSVVGLPGGVTSGTVELGETEKEITLQLTASVEACPFSGPIQIRLQEDGSGVSHLAVYELITTSLKNGVPQGFRELVIRSTDQLWLSVFAAGSNEAAKEK